MPASSQYHVILDGQGYLIDLDSYRKRAAEPFAPKDRQGDPTYGDLSVTSVWAQEDWRLGFSFKTWTTSAKMAGFDQGILIEPHFGDLRMGRSLTTVHSPGSTTTDIPALSSYKGRAYAVSLNTNQIWESSDGTTWTEVLAAAPAGRRSMATFNGWLIAGSNVDGILTRFDGTAWTATWVTLTGTRVRSLTPWQVNATTEYVFCGVDKADKRADLVRVDSAAVATVIATFQDTNIDAMIPFDGLLWIATSDDSNSNLEGALYTYDGTEINRVLTIPENAIASFAVYQGRLYAGSITRGRIWQVTAQGLTEIWTFPDVAGVGAGGAGGVSNYAQPVWAMLVDDQRLHVSVVDTQGLGTYAYDGLGWAQAATGGSGQKPRALMAFKQDLYISNFRQTGANVIRFNRQSPTSGTWVSSLFNAGLAATQKLWLSLDLYHASLAPGDALTVDYGLDDSQAWTNLGVSDTDGTTSKTFTFATGVTSKKIRLRISFALTDQTKTPKITGILTHYRIVPDAKAEWLFDARLEGTAEVPLRRLDNSTEPLTGEALANTLWTSKAKKQTLSFTDYDAETKTVHLVDLEERVGPTSQRLGVSTRGRVTLVEA